MTASSPLLARRLGQAALDRFGEHRRPGRPEARAFHARTQLPVLAWSPLGAGFLTSNETGGCYGSGANVARRERARTLARQRGWTVAQVALAYLFSQPFPVSAVVAASTGAKMRENLAASAFRLTPAELEALEA
jgi:aryl-alcohol dehydrogenase-like predicted oxidoreductase